MSMGPLGLGTKNNCAGEGRQQFSSQSVREPLGFSRQLLLLEAGS
jgi:hypothetical protein